ncbi:hypothetical protein [Caballeronia sp. ATUFL_M2_KS44]|uniref:hypothetical protein n=1 Tax=Caballeronia sp. ATUFL_M2_KS44 TaxID=2921767 RepID=UPI0020298675|nr:hypothetical protein [Caballeronia sp. ATUFL_M2_KS44]
MKTNADTSVSKFAGRDWYYDFKVLSTLENKACTNVADRMTQRYTKEAKLWTEERNSGWTCRLFTAAKLIMAATLHVNACDYSEEKNLRVVAPYLRYYAVLSLLRAVCHTLPEFDWNGGALIQMAHGKAIDGAISHLRRFDPAIADGALKEVKLLKAERELVSYRAPSAGDENVGTRDAFVRLCQLLCDVAQFNSELLERCIIRHADKSTFQLRNEDAEKIAFIDIDGHYFLDDEDARRLSYLYRKQPCPTNLMFYMKEGFVDDFFQAWGTTEEDERFNPHDSIRCIFDIP